MAESAYWELQVRCAAGMEDGAALRAALLAVQPAAQPWEYPHSHKRDRWGNPLNQLIWEVCFDVDVMIEPDRVWLNYPTHDELVTWFMRRAEPGSRHYLWYTELNVGSELTTVNAHTRWAGPVVRCLNASRTPLEAAALVSLRGEDLRVVVCPPNCLELAMQAANRLSHATAADLAEIDLSTTLPFFVRVLGVEKMVEMLLRQVDYPELAAALATHQPAAEPVTEE